MVKREIQIQRWGDRITELTRLLKGAATKSEAAKLHRQIMRAVVGQCILFCKRPKNFAGVGKYH